MTRRGSGSLGSSSSGVRAAGALFMQLRSRPGGSPNCERAKARRTTRAECGHGLFPGRYAPECGAAACVVANVEAERETTAVWSSTGCRRAARSSMNRPAPHRRGDLAQRAFRLIGSGVAPRCARHVPARLDRAEGEGSRRRAMCAVHLIAAPPGRIDAVASDASPGTRWDRARCSGDAIATLVVIIPRRARVQCGRRACTRRRRCVRSWTGRSASCA